MTTEFQYGDAEGTRKNTHTNIHTQIFSWCSYSTGRMSLIENNYMFYILGLIVYHLREKKDELKKILPMEVF